MFKKLTSQWTPGKYPGDGGFFDSSLPSIQEKETEPPTLTTMDETETVVSADM